MSKNFQISMFYGWTKSKSQPLPETLNEIKEIEVDAYNQRTPTVHYVLAKIKVQQQILNPDNLDETEDLLQILIRLNKNINLFTENYRDETELLSLKVMLAELYISKTVSERSTRFSIF